MPGGRYPWAVRAGGPLLGGGEVTPLTIFGADLQTWHSGLRSGGVLRDESGGETAFDPLSSAPSPVGANWRLKELNDISGNGITLTELTSNRQCIYDETTGEIISDATTRDLATATGIGTLPNPFTLAAVLTMQDPAVFKIFFQDQSGGATVRIISDGVGGISVRSATTLTTSALTPGQRYRFIWNADGVNSEIFIDGVSDVAGDAGTSGIVNGFTWHNSSPTGGFSWNEESSELVIASVAADADQIAALDSYLATEWGF